MPPYPFQIYSIATGTKERIVNVSFSAEDMKQISAMYGQAQNLVTLAWQKEVDSVAKAVQKILVIPWYEALQDHAGSISQLNQTAEDIGAFLGHSSNEIKSGYLRNGLTELQADINAFTGNSHPAVEV